MSVGNEEGKGRYFGSSVADCFMTWVNILERAEKKGDRNNEENKKARQA